MTLPPFALTTYGFPHRMGYLPTQDGTRYASPLTVPQVLHAVRDFRLAGVDMPLPDPATFPDEQLCDLLAERGLKIVAEFIAVMDAPEEVLTDYLRRAAFVGANVVRVLISTVLCGDRRTLAGSWEARLLATAERLRKVLPLATDLGLCIAVENHQDATTDDLLRLHDKVGHHPAFGITFDTGNPLAVGEEPTEAARTLAPLIRHLHLKDYTIYFAPEGFRLVRCAAGDGVIDFPAILAAVGSNGHALLPGIEIAAQPTRTIPLLDAGWWAEYPPRQAKDLAPALSVLWKQGRPVTEAYSSVWERGGDSDAVSADEWDTVTRSVAYFRALQEPAMVESAVIPSLR